MYHIDHSNSLFFDYPFLFIISNLLFGNKMKFIILKEGGGWSPKISEHNFDTAVYQKVLPSEATFW